MVARNKGQTTSWNPSIFIKVTMETTVTTEGAYF